MLSKQRSLQRIAALYAVVAEARAYDLEVATMRLRATEMAIAREHRFIREASADGRLALGVENSLDWRAAEVTALVSQRGIAALSERRFVEVDQREDARGEYLQAKQRSEQVKQVVKGMLLQTAKVEARAEQARSDDRFLARKHWLALQQR